MPRPKGLLFDKDGTLIDFDRTWGPAARLVMSELAAGDEAAFDRLARVSLFDPIADRFERTSPLVAGSSAGFGGLWADALGRGDGPDFHAEIDRLFLHHGYASLAPIGNPAEVLGALAGMGLRLGIATNDSEVSARRQSEVLGLSDMIEFVAGYDTGHGAKPEPGMVLAFVGALGCAPDEVMMIGDSTHDLHAARAAGAIAVAVLSGPAPHDELAPHADHVIGTIAELPELVRRYA